MFLILYVMYNYSKVGGGAVTWGKMMESPSTMRQWQLCEKPRSPITDLHEGMEPLPLLQTCMRNGAPSLLQNCMRGWSPLPPVTGLHERMGLCYRLAWGDVWIVNKRISHNHNMEEDEDGDGMGKENGSSLLTGRFIIFWRFLALLLYRHWWECRVGFFFSLSLKLCPKWK